MQVEGCCTYIPLTPSTKMSFSISRKAWTECYALFRLLRDGRIAAGTATGVPDPEQCTPVTRIVREEGKYTRQYLRTATHIEITAIPREEESGEPTTSYQVSLEEWDAQTTALLQALRQTEGDEVTADDGQEAFMDRIGLYELAGTAQGPERMTLTTGDGETGCSLWTRTGPTPHRLLDGGRAANLKLAHTGARFSSPEVNKVNALETAHTVRDRMWLIEQTGGTLRYHDVADRVFRANLNMIDLHMGRLLTEMVRTSYTEESLKLADLAVRMNELNPLKVKDELIVKHGFYTYKIKQLLLACAAGMRPAKIFTGTENLPAGIIVLNADGTPQLFRSTDRNLLADFLFGNTRLERGALEKDKYGYMERENNAYYFKLNLKIALTKR